MVFNKEKIEGVRVMVEAIIIILGILTILVFGIMAFQAVQDYLEERKH